MLFQHRRHSAAQKSRKVPGHRRDDQHLSVLATFKHLMITAKMNEIAKRHLNHRLFNDGNRNTVHFNFGYVEIGLPIAFCSGKKHFHRSGGLFGHGGVRKRIKGVSQRLHTHFCCSAPWMDGGMRHFIGVIEWHQKSPDLLRIITIAHPQVSELAER